MRGPHKSFITEFLENNSYFMSKTNVFQWIKPVLYVQLVTKPCLNVKKGALARHYYISFPSLKSPFSRLRIQREPVYDFCYIFLHINREDGECFENLWYLTLLQSPRQQRIVLLSRPSILSCWHASPSPCASVSPNTNDLARGLDLEDDQLYDTRVPSASSPVP